MAIRVFIGLSSITRGICTLTSKEDDSEETVCYPPIDTKIRDKSEHAIILACLAQYLEQAEEGSKIIFYSGNNILSFEWEVEYKEDKKFSSKTEDIELFNEIITLVEAKHIDLTIEGEDSILYSFRKLMEESKEQNNKEEGKEEMRKKYKILSIASRQKTINNILNDMVKKYPNYERIISYLCLYPLQSWASEMRDEVCLDAYSLERALADNDEYFGFRNIDSSSLTYQKESLRITSEILYLFDCMMTDDCLNKSERKVISFIFFEGEDISHKLLTDNLEPALLKVFSKYNDQFLDLADEIDCVGNELSEETLLAFHNIKVLFELTSLLGRYDCITIDINKKDIYAVMLSCIKALENYPFSPMVKKVTLQKFYGKTTDSIVKDLRKHADYVNERYKKGLEALEAIFWGYAYNDRKIDVD